MIGNVIIFTDYYVHSLLEIVEESSLTTGLFCVSDYTKCIQLVQTTPNLLGVLIIDWKPTKRTLQFYKELFQICDHIAFCREKPITLSILYRVKKSGNYFRRIKTKYLYLYVLRLKTLTDEIIKLDGLGPIFSESQGLFNVEESYSISPSRSEFDSDYFNTVVFALLDPEYVIEFEMIERHPLLRSIQNYRNNDLSAGDLRKLLEHTPFSQIF